MNADLPPIHAETAANARLLVCTSDRVFAMALTAGLARDFQVTHVPVDRLLHAVRTASNALILVDLDEVEIAAAVRLVSKLTLVTRSPIVMTGTHVVEGAPALEPLLLCGAAGILPKPEGRSSVGLCAPTGSSYVEWLRRAALASPNRTHTAA